MKSLRLSSKRLEKVLVGFVVDAGDFGGESLVVVVGKSGHGSVILIERIVISFTEDREKFVTLSDDDEWNLCVERGRPL